MKTLLICVLLLSGCASAGLNASCGHIVGNEVSIPYVGGKANGNAYACHIGCFGMGCPKPDYTSIQTLTSDYIKLEGNAISTTLPMTVTMTPTK